MSKENEPINQSVKDSAEDFAKECIDKYDSYPEYTQRQVFYEMVSAFTAGFEYSTQEKQGWVKTSERLPEHLEMVLIWSNVVDCTEPYKGYLAKGRWFSMSGTQIHSVTHWMPLPSKPEV